MKNGQKWYLIKQFAYLHNQNKCMKISTDNILVILHF